MEKYSNECAEGNDQQQSQSSTTMKQQPQHQAPMLQSFGQPSSSQQRTTSPFPPLNLAGSTVFEWATPMKPYPFGSVGANQFEEAISNTSINNTNDADSPISITSHPFHQNALDLVIPNPKQLDKGPSTTLDDKDPKLTVSNGTMTQSTTPVSDSPQHYHHPPMDPKYQSLFFLQTAAEQETFNKAIEQQNTLMHQRLVAMAKRKNVTSLDQEIEDARTQLRRQSLEEQTQKREALAKENAKMQLKLAQVQWRSPKKEKKVAPVVEQRLQDLEQDRLEKQEEQRQRNEQVAKENARLKLKIAQVQWKQHIAQLDPSVEQRRKDLREERRKSMEERKQKNKRLAKENARLKKRLSQVRGKVIRKLDPIVEQRRLDLVEDRRKSLEQLKQAQARQVATSSLRIKTRVTTKSPTNTSLDRSIEERRQELEHQRRQKAERKRQELRAHTKAMKERICSAKGREQRSLDKATKSKRKELQEKRAKEKFQQEQERKKQNLAIRKRMTQFLESDEYYDNSPAATGTRFPFDEKEERQMQKKRQQQTLQQKKEELETHRKQFLKRTRGVKRGRTSVSLDAEVEALRKDLAQKSISDNHERTQKIRKQNVELKQRLSDITGKETKSLSGVVQAIRSEREQSRKQAVLQRHKELMQHQRAYKKRLSDVTSRDTTKLKETTQTIRSQRNAKRNTAVRQKQQELAQHKARLQQMVKNVKSPIQQMLHDTSSSSPPLTFSKFRSSSDAVMVTTTTPSPVSFVSSIDTKTSNHCASLQSPSKQQQQVPNIKLFDFQAIPNPTSPENLMDAANQASSSEKKRLGPKRIVEACQRNQQLRDQNLKLRKRLAEATAASIEQLEASIAP